MVVTKNSHRFWEASFFLNIQLEPENSGIGIKLVQA